ncbi:hypothetical protein F4861DRAFT_549765 [Xylaria intraflava]|nr:hypothetical protein F4861DRAFT_549765 [Xylaria intraflava]
MASLDTANVSAGDDEDDDVVCLNCAGPTQNAEGSAEEVDFEGAPCRNCVTSVHTNNLRLCCLRPSKHRNRCTQCCHDRRPCRPIPHLLRPGALLSAEFGTSLRQEAIKLHRLAVKADPASTKLPFARRRLVNFCRRLHVLRNMELAMRHIIDAISYADQATAVVSQAWLIFRLLALLLTMLIRLLMGNSMDHDEVRARAREILPYAGYRVVLSRLNRYLHLARDHDFNHPLPDEEKDWVAQYKQHPRETLAEFFALGSEGFCAVLTLFEARARSRLYDEEKQFCV